VLVVLVGLLLARVFTFSLFRIALPFLLGVLAWFFGGALRDAARRVTEIGRAGESGLRGAARRVQGFDPNARARRGSRRYRVEPERTVETEGEAVEDFEDVDDYRKRSRR
jgi:hypothetical protein